MRSVFHDGASVLLVNHDTEGDWQFLTSGPFSADLAMVVGLGEMIAHDGSLEELFDLPRGWEATRTAPGRPWVRCAARTEQGS